MRIKVWLEAFRLRTLPLALSSILMGTFLAAREHYFSWAICIMALLTTLFLQILSNLANDYGDSAHGADHELRSGPLRTVQKGLITKQKMFNAIVLFVVLSLISGLSLLFVSFQSFNYMYLCFLLIGIISIAAAIKYTMGKNPYGYLGFGDLSVFVFFGMVGVCGSFFLYNHSFRPLILLPAYSCGVFSMAVLNLNNMRDIVSDSIAHKKTIPNMIGYERAKLYHSGLIVSGIVSAIIYVVFTYQSPYNLLLIISFPLLIKNMVTILESSAKQSIDGLLKQMALATLLFVISFGTGLLY